MSFTPDNRIPQDNGKAVYEDSTDSTKGFVSLLSEDAVNADASSFKLNSKAQSFVAEFIKENENRFENMKVWGQKYFVLYDNIFRKYGLPLELKYLSVIESDLQSKSVSGAGAVGPWQIMPTEARRCGLKTGGKYDERCDYTKSTNAAAKMLKSLYENYGDWLLVIAAYNAGSGGVNKAIKKAGSRDFWELQYYLPAETRNHVKKFIATHYFFEGSGGWTTVTAKEAKNLKLNGGVNSDEVNLEGTSTYDISGKYNSVVIATFVGMDVKLLNQLNPGMDKALSEGKSYQLRLPEDKMSVFQSKRLQIIKESVQLLLSSASRSNVKGKEII